MRKSVGGKRFKNIYAFNIAMLRKQGWNFMTILEALVLHIFKAIYYPKGDFLESKLGHKPCYSWSSIWSSCVLLSESFGWILGDRSKVKVWYQLWIWNSANPKPFYYPSTEMQHLTMQYLFVPGEKRWDNDIVNSIFNLVDVVAILNYPLYLSIKEDMHMGSWKECFLFCKICTQVYYGKYM